MESIVHGKALPPSGFRQDPLLRQHLLHSQHEVAICFCIAFYRTLRISSINAPPYRQRDLIRIHGRRNGSGISSTPAASLIQHVEHGQEPSRAFFLDRVVVAIVGPWNF
jgi:hypothetical protein